MESTVVRESLAAAVERGERVVAVVRDLSSGADLVGRVEKALKDGVALRARHVSGSGAYLELKNGGALWAVSVGLQHAGRGRQVDRVVNCTDEPLPERMRLALLAAVRP